MRSPLARAIGLGSAKTGAGTWWAERVSAVALVPLTLWFSTSIIVHSDSDYPTFIAPMRSPFAATLMILLLIALFHHTALGLQVTVEDYVHSGVKFVSDMAVRVACCARHCCRRSYPSDRFPWLNDAEHEPNIVK